MSFAISFTSVPALLALLALVLVPLYTYVISSSPKKALLRVPTPSPFKQTPLTLALTKALPDITFDPEHPAHAESVGSLFAREQRSLIPSLIIRPATTADVAHAISIIREHFDLAARNGGEEVKFAIRSGGHNPVLGANTVHGGVVLDLRRLNDVVVAGARDTVDIGVGARWGDVSTVLDGMGLAVAAGRNASVGVGGLSLGGGISSFSPRFGFVANNITSYEIVLASGSITTASATHNEDLFRALKGGANNFGVVTRITAQTFPSGQVWGGFVYSLGTQSTRHAAVKELHKFTARATHDAAAAPLACIIHVQVLGKLSLPLVAMNLVYTKPEAWPACYAGFKAMPRVWSSAKVQSITELTMELVKLAEAGLRQWHLTTSVENDLDTLMHTHDVWQSKRDRLATAGVRGLIWEVVLQPLSPQMMRLGQANVLGLEDRTEPLIVVLVLGIWKDEKDDDLVHACGREAITEIEAFAKKRGTAHRYKYLNYAAGFQNPFPGYGEKNHKFLVEKSVKYDPNGLFQFGCPGGFKLRAAGKA